ncbi:MAG: GNAT family N-acetyltransferase [Negativicutes bacterium]|nr:GNAT family N-acetyltransferase [Negativicutes bacterium]
MIRFREIDRENLQQVIRLKVMEEQKSFVASNLFSIAEAKAEPECVPLAVFHDETAIGFVMYCLEPQQKEYWIYRVMIDEKYQSQGFGRRVMQMLIYRIQQDLAYHKIYISFAPDNLRAKSLYESLGFKPDGRLIDGELIYLLTY